MEQDISPELTSFSPWLQEVLSDSEGLSRWGIDPGMAAVFICSTFIILRVLNILKSFIDIWLEDMSETKRLERQKKRYAWKRELREGGEDRDRIEDIMEDNLE